MASIHRTVDCPLPGFEGVTVTYNLMASGDDIERFTQEIGETGPVVVSVSGWPEGFGRDPFGNQAPMAFRIWAVQGGLQSAIKAFVADPLS